MTIRVRCTHEGCQEPYDVAEEQLGYTVVCPKCNRPFVIQASTRDATDETLRLDTDEFARPSGGQKECGRPQPPSGASSATLLTRDREVQLLDKIGRFKVLQRLGAGAFGQVYRARDPLLDREVALKVPHPATLQSETRGARVLTEAKAAAQLRHPNIVPVFEVAKQGDTYYIASAFIEGTTLEDAIDQRRPDFREAAKLVMDLAGALDYAHQRGVVHRDIKPANIMLDAQGDPLLMDFGLARLEAAESKLTHDGTVLGTPAYMSPEQAGGHLGVIGPATDQYSLGVVLYELLCGSTPFSGPPAMIISLVINQEPESPRKGNPAVPKDLETICLKAMAKQREHRYASCHEMAEDLRRWLAGESITARRVSPAERLVRWCRRNPAVAGLSGSAASLLLLVALVSMVAYIKTSSALATAENERQQAEEQRQRAELALGTAETERGRAENALTTAETERQRAEEQGRLARQNEVLAVEREELSRKHAYVATMNLAFRTFEDGQVLNAVELLRGLLPDSGEEDLRGFEWYFLWRRCHNERATFRGHEGAIRAVAVRGDGQLLATAGADGTIRLWNAETGDLLDTLSDHEGEVLAVAFSRDGSLLASAGADRSVRLRDGNDGRSLAVLTEHKQSVRAVRFSPDGQTLASGSADRNDLGSLIVWDVATRKPRWTVGDAHTRGNKDHFWGIAGVDYAPDGKTLATAGFDGWLKLWNAENGENLAAYKPEPAAWIRAVAFAPDGRTVASCGEDGTAKIWDVTSWRPHTTLRSHAGTIHAAAFSEDGKLLAAGAQGALVWNLDSHRAYGIGHAGELFTVAFAPKDRAIFTAGADGQVKRWELATLEHAPLLQPARKNLLVAVSFAAEAPVFVTADWAARYTFWDLDQRKEVAVFSDKSGFMQIAIAPDGRMAAVAPTLDAPVELRRLPEGDVVATLKARFPATFSRDGRTLATMAPGVDKAVIFWDTATHCAVRSWQVKFIPDNLFFTADGERLVLIADRQMELQDLAGKAQPIKASIPQVTPVWDNKRLVSRHLSEAGLVALAPDGNTLACQAPKDSIRLRDLRTGRLRAILRGHTGTVQCICFSPDGRTLVSGSFDMTVRLWNVDTGREITTLRGHRGSVWGAAFSPDGRTLVTVGGNATSPGGSPGEIRLWEAATLAEVTGRVGAEPSDPGRLLEPFTALVTGAADLWASGQQEQARQLMAEAIHGMQSLCNDETIDLQVRQRCVGPWGAACGEAVRRSSLELVEPAMRSAADVQRNLIAAHPEAAEHHRWLGAVLNDWATRIDDPSRAAEAQQMLYEAIEVQERALALEVDDPTSLLFLRNHYMNLAWLHLRQKRHQEAIQSANKVAEVRAPNAGDYMAAASIAASCAATAAEDQAMEAPEREKLSESYARQVVGWLREGLQSGLLPANLQKIVAINQAFTAIRGRADFRRLCEEYGIQVETNTEPSAAKPESK
ncbi:MAG: protein kinase [Thermoguttaceae bacterium]|jgi:WD40 repeat protein/tRNA A-37 threonylcarbamoyl transferase component Bud32|nr:protein kinase [Thermoguttaceae bacterium]